MYFQYKEININYEIHGTGPYLLLLHGWGQHSGTFENVVKRLKENYTIITVDFCGFGINDEPFTPLTLNDYVDHIASLINYLKLYNLTILGHSFGGRVAIRYASKYNLEKLILVDAAGIKRFNFKTFIKVLKYKFLKTIYRMFSKAQLQTLMANSGSSDYKKATPIMKKTMSNVIKVNLIKDLSKIKAKTLILWGYNDKVTPFSDSRIMENKIKNSRLVTFLHSGHFPYIDEEEKFIKIMKGELDV